MTPPTLDEHRAWAATAGRNWTDEPIGTTTTHRRHADMQASAAQTPADEPPDRLAAARRLARTRTEGGAA